MNTRNEVIDVLQKLQNCKELNNIKIGLFGSFSRNKQTENSDVDIVLKSNNQILLSYSGLEDFIKTYIIRNLGLDCDILDYEDICKEYEKAKIEGLEDYTLKYNIDKEVIWIDEQNLKN